MFRSAQSKNTSPAIVINAMNLGRYLDGIGTYTFNLLRGLAEMQGGMSFIIYVNRAAAEHLSSLKFPPSGRLVWVNSCVSPDHGFRGHFVRLLLSQWIGLKHYRSLVVTTSQLEAIFLRKNQIITIHDVIPLLFRECHRKQYFYFRRLLPTVLRRAKAVITPSRHTKGLLEQVYRLPSAKIRVIHNGVRLPSPSVPHHPEPRPFILYTGRIVRMKNITGVLRAFALLRSRIPHSLVITGHGRERMLKQFDPSTLSGYDIPPDRVVFAGHLSFEGVAQLLRAADVLIFPSFYEGFGLPPLEAMAAGCPSVVSRVGSLPEICGDAALYVDPYDTEGIAEGMYRILSDRALREDMIRKGLSRARLFSWGASVRNHLILIGELVHLDSTAPSNVIPLHQPVISR